MKDILKKLDEQLRLNLKFTESHYSETQKRLGEIEAGRERGRRELGEILQKEKERNEAHIKEVIEDGLRGLQRQTLAFEDQIRKVEEEMDKDVIILKDAIEKTRESLVFRVESLGDRYDQIVQRSDAQMQKVFESVKQSKDLAERLEKKVVDTLDEWGEKIDVMDQLLHGDMGQISEQLNSYLQKLVDGIQQTVDELQKECDEVRAQFPVLQLRQKSIEERTFEQDQKLVDLFMSSLDMISQLTQAMQNLQQKLNDDINLNLTQGYLQSSKNTAEIQMAKDNLQEFHSILIALRTEIKEREDRQPDTEQLIHQTVAREIESLRGSLNKTGNQSDTI